MEGSMPLMRITAICSGLLSWKEYRKAFLPCMKTNANNTWLFALLVQLQINQKKKRKCPGDIWYLPFRKRKDDQIIKHRKAGYEIDSFKIIYYSFSWWNTLFTGLVMYQYKKAICNHSNRAAGSKS